MSTGVQRAEALRQIYEKTVFRYAGVADDDAQLAFLLAHLPSNPTARIVDAGCGNGRYALALAKRGYSGILGCDLFEQVDTQGVFEYRKASVDKLPVPDGSVDFVYSNSVIYHLDEPGDAIREFARVLKPGARMVATVHSKYSLFSLHSLYKMWRGTPDAVHLRHAKFLSPFVYQKYLEANGMKVISLDGYRLSFLLYPIYFRFVYRAKKYFGIRLPQFRSGPSSSSLLRLVRSVAAYHTVIVAEKA
jgi:SAM-dependent methyltransferase